MGSAPVWIRSGSARALYTLTSYIQCFRVANHLSSDLISLQYTFEPLGECVCKEKFSIEWDIHGILGKNPIYIYPMPLCLRSVKDFRLLSEDFWLLSQDFRPNCAFAESSEGCRRLQKDFQRRCEVVSIVSRINFISNSCMINIISEPIYMESRDERRETWIKDIKPVCVGGHQEV